MLPYANVIKDHLHRAGVSASAWSLCRRVMAGVQYFRVWVIASQRTIFLAVPAPRRHANFADPVISAGRVG